MRLKIFSSRSTVDYKNVAKTIQHYRYSTAVTFISTATYWHFCTSVITS